MRYIMRPLNILKMLLEINIFTTLVLVTGFATKQGPVRRSNSHGLKVLITCKKHNLLLPNARDQHFQPN